MNPFVKYPAEIFQDDSLKKAVGISKEQFVEGEKLLNDYVKLLVLDAFHRMDVFRFPESIYHKDTLKSFLNIQPNQERLFEALLDILERADFIRQDDSRITVSTCINSPEITEEIRFLKATEGTYLTDDRLVYEFIKPNLKFVTVCISGLPDVLSGKRTYLDVMFPGGDMSLIAATYKGCIQTYMNNSVAIQVEELVAQKLRKNPNAVIHLLEVGAGTGGTTAIVLEKIEKFKANVKFWYTDIAAGFTRVGRREFAAKYPFMEFKALDISKNPVEQGFVAEDFDIIICNNVLHATSDMETCLLNVGILLKSGGNLLANDLTKRLDFNTVTFGLTKDWWNFQDISLRVSHAPVLTVDSWKECLESLSFSNIEANSIPGLSPEEYHQSIIIAQK
jgi:ubiquinone/menaquinone biosynthesis C-methylase UbiE